MTKKREMLLRNLDKVFLLYISKRDKYACVVTGAKRNLTLFRFVDSESFSVKYNPYNACILATKIVNDKHGYNPDVINYFLSKLSMSEVLDMFSKKCYTVSENKIIEKTNELVALTNPIRSRGRWDG